jgi:hypothetical protein
VYSALAMRIKTQNEGGWVEQKGLSKSCSIGEVYKLCHIVGILNYCTRDMIHNTNVLFNFR